MAEDLTLYKSREGYETMMAFYNRTLEKLNIPFESDYVDTRFGRTHMLIMGPAHGFPLLLVQGLAGSAPLWHQQFSDFAQHFRVYALDTVGQPGRSDPTPLSFFDDSYAEWLLDILDGMGIEQANFAGVSSGGWVIIKLGIIAPKRIHKAILLSPMGLARAKLHVGRWIPNPLNRKRQQATSLEDRLTVRSFTPEATNEEYDRTLARAMALATKHFRVDRALGIRPDQSILSKLWTGSRLLAQFMLPTPRAELRRFNAPTLLILGEHEVLYNTKAAVKRARSMPNLNIEIVPNAGHAAIYDRPAYVNSRIVEFLIA